uniref:SCP domain-containing protein n=1 Tax=Caenorhabditis japonica TaxID=281687 RepID=A0A2Q4T247_CAEJA
MSSILFLSALCLGAYAQFSPTAQQAIVDVHNAMRSKIARGVYVAKEDKKPSGTNILKMKWDPSIAAVAQKYSDTCPSGHSGIEGVGENLFWMWTSAEITDLDRYGKLSADHWEKEFQSYGWKYNTLDGPLVGTGVGHATQMAWADSGIIGCGVTNCGRDTNGMNKAYVVCHYKNPGNVLTWNIYNSGRTCSACPSGTSCEKSTGLCV